MTVFLRSLVLSMVAVPLASSYIVGTGLNARFSQLRFSDPKFQTLRQEMMNRNTASLARACSDSMGACYREQAYMRFKASKHFFTLAKAVIDYIVNKRTARPAGYVGTAVFCRGELCMPESEPPVVQGGCITLIGCGGDQPWNMDPVTTNPNRRYWDEQLRLQMLGAKH